jgi:hypothetical protein
VEERGFGEPSDAIKLSPLSEPALGQEGVPIAIGVGRVAKAPLATSRECISIQICTLRSCNEQRTKNAFRRSV